jgi:hypothetical protein
MFHGRWVAALACVLALAGRADAHRLDEYLQATRVSVSVDRIRIELDLSPGVAVADAVIRAIDTNGDGVISDDEASDYAATVLQAVTLTADARPVALRLDARVFPAMDSMRAGLGMIRLAASADVPARAGHRELAITNAFQPAIGVYLVNALVPSDSRITITAQRRDPLQRTLALDYDVSARRAWIGWSGAAIAVIGLLLIGRARRSRLAAAGP